MILFFDTETTGLPNNWSAPISDTNNWPRMVQLAYTIFENNGTLIESKNYIIKPEGYIIPPEVSQIHGITTERAIQEGIELTTVLSRFQSALKNVTLLVAHNIEFDEKIIGSEFYRIGRQNPLISKQKFCTMKNSNIISYCAVPPFRYGSYKWPKLSELHYKLFGNQFEEAHNAAIDIKATAKCFWELKNRKIIKVENFVNINLSTDKINNGMQINHNYSTTSTKSNLGKFLFFYGLIVTIIFFISLANGFNDIDGEHLGLTFFFSISSFLMWVGLFIWKSDS